MSKKVVLVIGSGDYEGLYIDGVLKVHEYVVTAAQALDALGIAYSVVEPNEEWHLKQRRLPQNLADVPKQK